MTDLRTAAQQMLEALDKSLYMNDYCGLEVSKHDQPDVTDAIENLRAALAEPETCTWQQDGDSDSCAYGTSCRRYFSINDGTPEDNKMAWCCYCGKKLAQELITEDEDE